MTTDADTIRSTVRIVDVLDALDLPHPDSSGKITSWTRDEMKPSVQIYENEDRDSWFDYGAGQGGDVIDLVKSYFGCSFAKAVRYLSGIADEGMVTRRHMRTTKPVINLTQRFIEESYPLDLEALDFICRTWGRWAHTSLTQGYFDVRRANGALWIAHYDPVGFVCGVKVRAYNGQRFSLDGSTFTQQLYWGRLDGGLTTCVITEGEPDTWTLESLVGNRCNVYGLPSGAGTWNDAWLQQLKGHNRIILCLDNDEAGRKATRSVFQKLLPNPEGRPPQGISLVEDLPAKDISDAVRLHGYDPIKEWAL